MKLILVILSVFVLFQSKAFAYLDPGSGSYIIQVLIALFVGSAFAVKMF